MKSLAEVSWNRVQRNVGKSIIAGAAGGFAVGPTREYGLAASLISVFLLYLIVVFTWGAYEAVFPPEEDKS